ncbi:type I phosphomannose isomerase catalytic subunit [Puniceicoccus vermicola]|uniref:Class I mannose-6-phosphate isomerase n=1 Tax=Puniceicoccus vermicola TaxID=388746 RepID=A0A7X1E577_9BACT|nr:type I phosphomannose isomerase catalytic subunit [Puniceicoccus vermicola]MBC2602839.1 class I mannose-6-phosphate isomerase [Puniceicoccus vermicola]
MNPVLFQPIYKERVWGGRSLEDSLGRELPGGKVIGESWDLVDRPDDASLICGSEDERQTIRSLIESDPEGIMGKGWKAEDRFPILVKWLDCQQRLSLQVHPPASIAPSLGGEPKTENWFVADTQADAGLIVGLKDGVTRDEFEAALKEETLEDLVHRFPVEPGQSILVESGRLHAIDAGNLILEIQQNSDTTYRVFDWGRKGLDGNPRQLHVDESMKSIDFNDFEPSALPSFDEVGETVLADCAEFRIRRVNLEAGTKLSTGAPGAPILLHVVSGKLSDSPSGIGMKKGDTVLLPASRECAIQATESCTVLLTDRFTPAG